MRGAGPTTQAAVRRFLATGELRAIEGSSIGAAMRALPFGWATPVAAAANRRELTIRLSRTTHGAPEAIISACVVAEMAARAIEQHPIDTVVAAGLCEAEELAQQQALHPGTLQPLRRAISEDWPSNKAEPTLDALATVANVLHVLREARGLVTAMKHAVSMPCLGCDPASPLSNQLSDGPLVRPWSGAKVVASGSPRLRRAATAATNPN